MEKKGTIGGKFTVSDETWESIKLLKSYCKPCSELEKLYGKPDYKPLTKKEFRQLVKELRGKNK